MPKLTVYIPVMKLNIIDAYCKEKKVARSVLLANSALAVINAKGGIRCDMCQSPAIGEFKMTVYTPDLGEQEQTKKLCFYHFDRAKQEGAIIHGEKD